MKNVYVTWANSESGDFYGPYVFDRVPTDLELEVFWRSECPGEWVSDEKGPGSWGSYLHVRANPTTIQKPVKIRKMKAVK